MKQQGWSILEMDGLYPSELELFYFMELDTYKKTKGKGKK